MRRLIAVLGFIVVLAGSGRPDAGPPKSPEFVFARLACSNRVSWQYWPRYWPNNPPWHHDYPEADEYIVALIHELTGIPVTPDAYKIVHLDNPEIFNYPFLYLSEPGFLDLNEKEIANLGEYIRRGGFIMADDFRNTAFPQSPTFRGPEELEVLRDYLKRAVPERELVRLDGSHPIFHSYYDVDVRDMNSPYDVGEPPQFWGMLDSHGKVQLIANYNNDVGDFWKYLDEGDKPLSDSARSIRLGINYFFYALTH
jgi:hypothetical protein